MKGKGIKIFVIGLILVCLVAGYYFYLSNYKVKSIEEDAAKISAVQEVLLRDLDDNYPPTPKEAVRFFAEITKCLYNETYTDEEFQQLSAKIEELYDEELKANQTHEQYIENLKWDINKMKEQKTTVSNYNVSSGTDVVYFNRDTYECAKLNCTFIFKMGNGYTTTKEVMVLRKDESGHWKILGWKILENGHGKNGDTDQS